MYHADNPGVTVAAAELLLEGLAAHRRISRAEQGLFARVKPEPKGKGKGGGFQFGQDLFA
jgi:hypothetical protein